MIQGKSFLRTSNEVAILVQSVAFPETFFQIKFSLQLVGDFMNLRAGFL